MDEFVFQKDFRMINLMPLISSDVSNYVLSTEDFKDAEKPNGGLDIEKNFVKGQPKGWGRVKIHLKHQSAFFITRKTKIRNLLEIHNT